MDFEERLSAFLEDELTPVDTRLFLQHASTCQACLQVLEGVQRVRAELRNLGAARAPAHYQLWLAGSLHDGLARTSPWLRSVALGVTIAAAMAILLWPQLDLARPGPVAAAQPTSIWAQHAGAWAGDPAARQHVEPGSGLYTPHPARAHYSYAQVRQASL
jgi:hypothetical protein